MADWIVVLRSACRRETQAAVARRLGVSPTMVNQALKGVYRGDLEGLQSRVEGALMGQHVICPVLGQLPRNECMDHQARPFATTNPLRLRMYRACRAGCPHSRLREGGS